MLQEEMCYFMAELASPSTGHRGPRSFWENDPRLENAQSLLKSLL